MVTHCQTSAVCLIQIRDPFDKAFRETIEEIKRLTFVYNSGYIPVIVIELMFTQSLKIKTIYNEANEDIRWQSMDAKSLKTFTLL